MSDISQVGSSDTYTAQVTYNNGPGGSFTPVSLSLTVVVNGTVNDLTGFAPNGAGWGANPAGTSVSFSGGVIPANWDSSPNADNLIGTINFVPASTECLTLSTSGGEFFQPATGEFRTPQDVTSNEKCFVAGVVKLATSTDALNSRVARFYENSVFTNVEFVGGGAPTNYLFERNGGPFVDIDCVLANAQLKFNGNVDVQDINGITGNIQGTAPFTEAYQMVAADVNKDEIVDVGDMVAIQRGLLGISEDDMVVAWDHPTDAWISTVSIGDNLPSAIVDTYQPLDILFGGSLDFTAIKSGDVIASDPDYDKSGVEETLLTINSLSLGRGEVFDVPVFIEKLDRFTVLKLSMSYSIDDVEVLDLTSGELSLDAADNYIIASELGQVNVLTNVLEHREDLSGKAPAFFLRVRAKRDLVDLQNSFELSQEEDSEIITLSSGKSTTATSYLSIRWQEVEVQEEEPFVRLLSSNPFRETLRVSISLDLDAFVTATLVDINGRSVASLQQTLARGANTLDLSSVGTSLPTGIYLLRINTNAGQHFVTKVVKQ